MLIPNRHGSSNSYRYGFNGMEKDDELKGIGNSYDFGARMLDPRVGRWFAKDPLEHKYPEISTYTFVINSPITHIDPDGKEVIPIHRKYSNTNPGIDSYITTKDSKGFIYERTKKAAEEIMKTEEGRNYIKMYMKKH